MMNLLIDLWIYKSMKYLKQVNIFLNAVYIFVRVEVKLFQNHSSSTIVLPSVCFHFSTYTRETKSFTRNLSQQPCKLLFFQFLRLSQFRNFGRDQSSFIDIGAYPGTRPIKHLCSLIAGGKVSE